MSITVLAPVFRRAAEVIEKNGHLKGAFYDLGTEAPTYLCPACAVGALCVAMYCVPADCDRDPYPGEDPLPRKAIEFFSARIYSNTTEDDPIERIADWNDTPERTPGEVVQAFREAAAAAEAVAS